MSEKAYLYLLIFCGFLIHQGIIASLSTSDNRDSSDFLIRNKRVINHEPGGHAPARLQDVKYIVNIRYQFRTICAGSILSHYTIITAASCVQFHHSVYEILSGSAYSRRCISHNATSISLKYGNAQLRNLNGIALLTVDPPFLFTMKTGSISLYTGPVLPGMAFEASGWGCSHPTSPPWGAQRRLRSVTLPILHNTECAREYQGHYAITNDHICTYDPNKYCAYTDVGAPLVFTNRLAGIHVYKGEIAGNRNPDVFLNLQRPEFANFIREHTLLM